MKIIHCNKCKVLYKIKKVRMKKKNIITSKYNLYIKTWSILSIAKTRASVDEAHYTDNKNIV